MNNHNFVKHERPPKNRKVTITKGITHAIFDCMDCDMTWGDYQTARMDGYNHAREKGHTVNGEVGMSYLYESIKKKGN